jgi:endonuclease YncB( thermonuclease family)
MWGRAVAVIALLLVAVLALSGTVCAQRTEPLTSRDETATDELVLVGRVTRIIDGDTLDVQLDSGPIRVRLDSIDAPERAQPWGDKATDALARRVADREVELSVTEQDRYDRLVSTVFAGGENVNTWLVEQGHAWAYRQYLNDKTMTSREEQARSTRVGLWGLANPIAPWEWRRGNRQANADFDDRDEFEPAGPDAVTENRTCGAKRYCSDMASCDEANFFLKQCGLSRLDGDDDGIPCEAVCP